MKGPCALIEVNTFVVEVKFCTLNQIFVFGNFGDMRLNFSELFQIIEACFHPQFEH